MACTPAINDPYPVSPGGSGAGQPAAPDSGLVVTPEGGLTASPLLPESIITEEAMTSKPPAIPPGLQGLVDLARADLAQRLGEPNAEIQVLEARAMVWPDGSLGCPKPGMLYPQVQVDGALIVLGVGGETYFYHSGGGRGPFLCENPSIKPDVPPPGFDK